MYSLNYASLMTDTNCTVIIYAYPKNCIDFAKFLFILTIRWHFDPFTCL